MNEIRITNLKIFANHGVYEFETAQGQNFLINARLYLDLNRAGREDELEQSVHYGEVCLFLKRYLTEHTFMLLEAACYSAMKALLLEFPLINKIEFELCKPEAPIPMEFENVSVSMEMGWHKVYIGLGSNMGKKKGYIEEVLTKFQKDDDFRNLSPSALIDTKPYGNVDQDDFVNGVLEAETLLEPFELLERLQKYENEAHRERKEHWGPRTLDLDILFYDDLILDSKDLMIPHPDLFNREFVLKPLCEIAPYLRHPLLHKTVMELYKALMEDDH